MKKLYRGSYIDASCQVWLHFAKQFQTVANQKQELPLAAILLANVKKIFSETAWPNGAKLGIDGPRVCPFRNYV
jgi:hypothetical protein